MKTKPVRKEHYCLRKGDRVILKKDAPQSFPLKQGIGKIAGFDSEFVMVIPEIEDKESFKNRPFPYMYPLELKVFKRIGQLHFMFS
jgi:hypothetical protein